MLINSKSTALTLAQEQQLERRLTKLCQVDCLNAGCCFGLSLWKRGILDAATIFVDSSKGNRFQRKTKKLTL